MRQLTANSPTGTTRLDGRFAAFLLVLCTLLISGTALAQGSGRYGGTTEAGQAFGRGQNAAAEGDRALRSGDASEAIEAYEEAETEYRRALDLDEDYEDARERLGYVLYVMDREDEAVEVLQEGLWENPNSLPLRRMLGINLYELERYDEAIPLLQAVDDEGGAEPHILFILGKHYYEQRNYDVAVGYLQRYLAENPSDPAAHGALGNAYLRTEQYELALVEFRTVLELAPGNTTALTNTADVYFAIRDFERAIEIYNRVLPEDPDNYRLWFNLGKSHLELEQHSEALPAFERMVEIQGDLYQGHYFQGVCLVELGRQEEARAAFGRGLDIRENHAMSHYRLGLVEASLGNTAAALESLSRARELSPDEAWFAHAMGNVLYSLGRVDEAIEQHTFAVEADATEGSFVTSLGRDYYAAGELDRADEMLREALVLDPSSTEAERALGVVLLTRARESLARNELDGARENLSRVESLGVYPLETALVKASLALIEGDDGAAAAALETVAITSSSELSYRRARAHLAVVQGEPELVEGLLSEFTEVAVEELEPLDAALLGHAAASRGDWTQALDLFQRGAEADDQLTNVALARFRVGLRLASRDRWIDAEEQLDRANELSSHLEAQDRVRLEYARAIAALNQDEFSAAVRRLSSVVRAIERLPDGERNRLGRVESLDLDLRLAYAQYRSGDFSDAIDGLERLAADGDDSTVDQLLTSSHERLAREAYERDDIRSARRHLERAVESAGQNSVARNNLACLQFAEGDTREAGDIFRDLAEDGSISNAIYNYAVYFDEVENDPQQAYEYYQRYLERGGDAEDEARESMRIKEEVFGFEPEG